MAKAQSALKKWYRGRGRRFVLFIGFVGGAVLATLIYPGIEVFFTKIGLIARISETAESLVENLSTAIRSRLFQAVVATAIGSLITIAVYRIRSGASIGHRIENAEQLAEALKLPVAGEIPFVEWRNVDEALRSPDSNLHEAYERLRSYLMIRAGGRLGTMMITGFLPDSGKTTTARALAASLDRQGLRVLLIDADLRHPKYRGPNIGLVSILQGETAEGKLVKDPDWNFDVLPVGETPKDSGSLLAKFRHSAELNKLCANYDAVLVDCAPLGMSGSLEIAEFCDLVLFVCSANRFNAEEAHRVKQIFDIVPEIKIIGLATKIRPKFFGFGHTYSYVYGYPEENSPAQNN